jgi:hypothetical protein
MGRPPEVLRREPPLHGQLAWIFAAYHEIDRQMVVTPFGAAPGQLDFVSMCAVLDEYGVTDKLERREIRGHWRAMAGAEAEVREGQRKVKEEEEKRRKRGPTS